MRYGLIGEHLLYSFSKEIHAKLGNYDYELCELWPNEVSNFLRQRKFVAINITIPYKQIVIDKLDWIEPKAKLIGAVNTIVNQDGKLFGYNADYCGLKALIVWQGLNYSGKKVLILGTGATSRTAMCVAKDLGAKIILRVSRHVNGGEIVDYETAKIFHNDADFIINTTPVGMYPNVENLPIELKCFKNLRGVTDVVYNPVQTKLVLNARKLGICAESGLYMLIAQAVAAAEIFFRKPQPNNITEQLYLSLVSSKTVLQNKNYVEMA